LGNLLNIEKKIRKSADLSPGFSLLLSLDLFLLIVLEKNNKHVKNLRGKTKIKINKHK